MRQIKFRGKIKESAFRWICGSYNQYNKCIVGANGGEYLVDENTIGQYTGLKDKNGKEIYEGDILRMYNTDEDYDHVTKVGEYGEVEYSTCDYDYTLLKWVDDWIEYEVIGNIYDSDLKDF